MGIDPTPRVIDLAQIITITTLRRPETQRRGFRYKIIFSLCLQNVHFIGGNNLNLNNCKQTSFNVVSDTHLSTLTANLTSRMCSAQFYLIRKYPPNVPVTLHADKKGYFWKDKKLPTAFRPKSLLPIMGGGCLWVGTVNQKNCCWICFGCVVLPPSLSLP